MQKSYRTWGSAIAVSVAATAHLVRASSLIGLNVENATGENLGEIKNLAIDPNCGCVRVAIMSYGGAIGIGDTHIAVPLKAFRFDAKPSKATLDLTKDRLNQAPKFDDKNWDVIADKNWNSTVDQFYNVKRDSDFQKNKEGADVQTLKPIKGSDLVGMDVHNRQDEDLGEIEDLMIDVNTGKIGYAVLAFGGVMGINEKLFAVPWQALSINAGNKQVVLGVDKEKLAQAPGFDKNNWPDMGDVNWSKDVHAFYGSDPNWIYGYSAPKDDARDDLKDRKVTDSGKGWSANSEYNRKFNASSVQTVTGTVTGIGNDEPMDGMSDCTVLTLRTEKGETVAVHLGPQWFIENQDQKFKDNEQVQVTGCRTDINGKPVIIASEVKRGGDVLRLRDKAGRPMWAAWHAQGESAR
jgi:sporulation protein YlmC with PRC-barrel domain